MAPDGSAAQIIGADSQIERVADVSKAGRIESDPRSHIEARLRADTVALLGAFTAVEFS